jgi:hypothetical protein
MKTTFQSRKDEVENIMLPSAASWAKSTPISLSNNRQFPALGQNAIELGIEPPVDLQLVVDEDHYSVLGSAILDNDEAYVPDRDNMDLKQAGFLLFPRYNGLFDPFGSDRLVNALLQAVVIKPDNESPTSLQSDGQKSRFERLFDGHPAEQVCFN